MRILICNWKDLRHPHAGGAEVYTHEVARRWVAAGHEVTQFCAAVDGARPAEDVDGVRIVRRGGRFGVYSAARRWYRYAGSHRFDLVVDEVNTRPFGCVRWVRDAPVVALIHQVCREIWQHEMPLPVALLGRHVLEPHWLRAYRQAPVLTVSESSRESLVRYGLRNVRLVPEGMHRRPRPAVPKESAPTLLFLGRLARNKGPLDALAAFHALRRRVPHARLWVVGDGPLRDEVATRAGDGVTLFGRVDERRRDELLARAHALLVTSVREGWALVVDEAAAMGTRAVGYRRPGLCDSVPAAGGVLVDPAPEAMAAALEQVLPAWMAEPVTGGWAGGAVDWDTVAETVLDQALRGIGRGTDEELRCRPIH